MKTFGGVFPLFAFTTVEVNGPVAGGWWSSLRLVNEPSPRYLQPFCGPPMGNGLGRLGLVLNSPAPGHRRATDITEAWDVCYLCLVECPSHIPLRLTFRDG